MLTLIRREFTAYFLSPIAYVVLTVFLIATGYLFGFMTLDLLTKKGPAGIEYPMQVMLGDERFWLVFLLIPALLTMRLFAEERGSGTLEMLLTAPIRDWQVVAAKFIAAMGFYFVLWLPTLLYLPVLIGLQQAEYHPVWTANSIFMCVGLAAAAVLALLMIAPFRPGLKLALYLAPAIVLPIGVAVILQLDHYQTLAVVVALATAANLIFLVAAPVSLGKLLDYSLEGRVGFVLGVAFLIAAGTAVYFGFEHFNRDPFSMVQVASDIDHWPVVTSYLGIMLVGAMFLALGMLVSSLVKSQMVAALITLVLSLVFVLPAFWRPEMDTASVDYRIRNFFSVPVHFQNDFSRGIIDTRYLILYGSVALCCLFLTVRSLESRRWR
jgi:ABC-type transport system involved in multi-copper enzyme maturation permease subunit